MTARLECLEERDLPSLGAPQIIIVSFGTDQFGRDELVRDLANAYLPIGAPYGVGLGSVIASVTLPSLGPAPSDAQVTQTLASNIAAGHLPQPGPESFYLLFGDVRLTDTWLQQASGVHSTFWYGGQWNVYAWVGPQPSLAAEATVASHELMEGSVDPSANNPALEVCDSFNGMVFNLHGYPVTMVAAPDGQPLVGVGLTETAALLALPSEQFFALAWAFAATKLPWFQVQADTAMEVLRDNPMAGTEIGLAYQQIGEFIFAEAAQKAGW